ncbi:MAG: cadherin-like domain-containing protein, partial [Azoarcus sp.]|nr:cadherin-like domain-containing protein [Azoarcus sp.]
MAFIESKVWICKSSLGDTSMVPNQVVATVDSIKGHAFARGPDNKVRPLRAGDPLYDGDTLVPDGPVVVAPDDGSAPFVANAPMAMGPDMGSDDESWIDNMPPNLDDLPPPAAPPGGGGGGFNWVELARIIERTDGARTGPGSGGAPLGGRLRSGGDPGTHGDGGGNPSIFQHDLAGTSDRYEVVEGSGNATFGNVLDNDENSGDLTVVAVIDKDGVEHTVPPGGSVHFETSIGWATIYSDGHFEYETPPSRDNDLSTPEDTDGSDDAIFQYIAADADGNRTAPVDVSITILDTVPEANDNHYTVPDTTELHGNVITDVDPQAGADVPSADTPVRVLSVQSSTSAEQTVAEPGEHYNKGTWTHITTDQGGTVWISPDGTFWYAPDPNYVGPDQFQYTIVDADGSTSTATVHLDVPPPD